MSTETQTTVSTPNEVVEVQGNKLIETVKGIIAKDNVSRLIIYWSNGDKLLDVSYAAGLTVTALVTLLLGPLAVVTPLAFLLGRFKIEIIRPESEDASVSEEAPSEPEGEEGSVSEEAPSEPEAEPKATSEETETPRTEVEVEIEPAAPAEEPEADDLKKITGIGKVFEGRLHKAGIYTFAQLAETPAEKITEIISPEKTEQMFDVQPWIAQARELSQMAF